MTAPPRAAVDVLLLVSALAGCAGEDAAPATGPGALPSPGVTSPAAAAPSRAPTAPPTPAGPTFTVTFATGRVSGDSGRMSVALDDMVSIVVTSDVADQLHLHGYDVSVPVTPGTPATLTFRATIPGVFSLELEELGKQLLSVQVA